MNRYKKSAKDAAEWMTAQNQCWFAARVVEVRRKYGLMIDWREADALERVLSACGSTEMVVWECEAPVSDPPTARRHETLVSDPLQLYDDNGNGRITCAEARKHGIAPVPRGHSAYRYMRDANGDGVVCE